ncbi:uncharacterized protein LOC132615818 [Lycium barbarum]|uniref:uncharacterized protein LOC132615818 n=1 Tax=Lycium barbarum TaxID=112863 RepID=UPI00293F0859|nr:uncharacterized protein LOC132615818 [Lycium barbarum]
MTRLIIQNLMKNQTLEKLLVSLPELELLDLDSYFVEVCATGDDAEAVWNYLDTPSCLERPLDKLKQVTIKFFWSSKAELLFVKLLLSRTPPLLSMHIDQCKDIGTDIALELNCFPRASPRAELFYSQH